MRTKGQIHFISWATAIPSLLSFTGSLFIVVGVLCNWSVFRKRYTAISSLLLKLSFCDLAFSALVVSEFLPPAMLVDHGEPVYTGTACQVVAAAFQACQVASFGWYTMLAVHSLRTLHSITIKSWAPVRRFPRREHAVVWGVAVLSAAIPAVWGAYGPDADTANHECWIPDLQSAYRLTFYVPLFLALCVAVFLLGYTVYLRRHVSGVPGVHRKMVSRSASFVAVFVLCWTPPLINRSYELISGKESWFPLEVCHAIGGASFGFGNSLAWMASRPFKAVVIPWVCCRRPAPCAVTSKPQSSSSGTGSFVYDTDDELEGLLCASHETVRLHGAVGVTMIGSPSPL